MSVVKSDRLDPDAAGEISAKLTDEASELQASELVPEEFDLTIHGFYHAVLQLLSSTVQVLKSSSSLSLSEPDISLSESCLNLLYVWAHGIDLRSLEFSVNKETGLQEIVAELLADIARLLSSDVFSKHSTKSRTGLIDALPNFLKRHVDQDEISDGEIAESVSEYDETTRDTSRPSVVSTVSDDDNASNGRSTSDDRVAPSPDSNSRPRRHQSNDSSGTRDSDQEAELEHGLESTTLKSTLIDIHSCVEALMDLLPTIDSCCNEQSARGYSQDDPVRRPHDVYLTDEAQPFINQILDKFSSIDESLAQRSGRANWERYIRLRSLEEHPVEGPSRPEGQATHSIFRPYTEFQDSGLGASLPAMNAYAKSNASHNSFISTRSACDRGVFRVPNTPEAVSAGVPFKCEICHSLVANIKDRIQWKLHVFADLQPYICTFENCNLVNLTFSTRKQWAAHEFSQHRRQTLWRCSKCLQHHTSEDSFFEHLTKSHPEHYDSRTKLTRDLSKASEHDVPCPIEGESCPYCSSNGFAGERAFRNHVCRHMEEVALAILPCNSTEDEAPDTEIDSDDLELAKSMSRRAKGYIPELIEMKCSDPGCGRIFTRKFDLAKHEKTHTRPFKCPTKSCKYHEVGLPTEKELARHMSDKHDPNPALYRCLYCEFKTKRESNCKQHMEKKHGWEYRRVKGRNNDTSSLLGQPFVDSAVRLSTTPATATPMFTEAHLSDHDMFPGAEAQNAHQGDDFTLFGASPQDSNPDFPPWNLPDFTDLDHPMPYNRNDFEIEAAFANLSSSHGSRAKDNGSTQAAAGSDKSE